MKYYKLNNKVYAYEQDGSQDHLITSDMVAMTKVEVEVHTNPPDTTEQLYAKDKESKLLAVSQIKVTTALGNVFDGDEVSQNRMSRAVTASNAGDTTQWILADNTQATVTHEELKEALLLSGEAMTTIWMT